MHQTCFVHHIALAIGTFWCLDERVLIIFPGSAVLAVLLPIWRNLVKGQGTELGCFHACMTVQKRKLHLLQPSSSQNAFLFFLHCTLTIQHICRRYSLWRKTRWQLKFNANVFLLMPNIIFRLLLHARMPFKHGDKKECNGLVGCHF